MSFARSARTCYEGDEGDAEKDEYLLGTHNGSPAFAMQQLIPKLSPNTSQNKNAPGLSPILKASNPPFVYGMEVGCTWQLISIVQKPAQAGSIKLIGCGDLL